MLGSFGYTAISPSPSTRENVIISLDPVSQEEVPNHLFSEVELRFSRVRMDVDSWHQSK